MLAINAPRRTFQSFHSDNEARVADFFEAYAAELPAQLGSCFKAYGEKFLTRHARVHMASLFRLSRGQANKVITDVHSELELPLDDEDAIRESIEEASGFRFAVPEAPASALLVTKRTSVEMTDSEESAVKKPKGQSLSQLIAPSEHLSSSLPDYVFEVVTTPDPMNNAITEPELSRVTDQAIMFMSKKYGRHNIGLPLARTYAAQIRARVKIGDRGKKNIVLGKDRDLASTLVEKARNRTYKPVSATTQPL